MRARFRVAVTPLLALCGACSRDAGQSRDSTGAAVRVSGARIAVAREGKPGEWPQQAGDYANSRYSELDQITAANAGALKVAWAFSTGVLRGHEGGPLVVDNTMYLVTPYPNVAYALDLTKP